MYLVSKQMLAFADRSQLQGPDPMKTRRQPTPYVDGCSSLTLYYWWQWAELAPTCSFSGLYQTPFALAPYNLGTFPDRSLDIF